MRAADEQMIVHRGSSRRNVLGWLAGAIASGMASLSAGSMLRFRKVPAGLPGKTALPDVPGSDIVRMQAELQAALRRPLTTRRWVMVIDPRRCTGCNTCVVSCRAENVTGPEGSYRRVAEASTGSFPNLTRVFMPSNCVHCDDPPCQRAVPAGMILKRPDGIVEFDYTKLVGDHARKAAEACPYRAVHLDEGRLFTAGTPSEQPYEKRTFTEYQREWNRTDGSLPRGAARKCHFCLHRVEAGMLPACVASCMCSAMAFGDLSDPAGLVSELLAANRTIRIHEELGIEPRVHYIEEKLDQEVRQYSCSTCH
jgi:molybdopterin-containing oxidoreductase family iron-sulfur binding subunit